MASNVAWSGEVEGFNAPASQRLSFYQRLSAFERFYHQQTNRPCPRDLLFALEE